MKRENELGEWEIDERGKRFRRVGSCIEYAPTIVTSYGEFEVGSVPPPPKEIEVNQPKSWGFCPLLSKCSPQCAMHGETGCAIVTGDIPNAGKRCPFSDKRDIFICNEKCALWKMCNRKVGQNAK